MLPLPGQDEVFSLWLLLKRIVEKKNNLREYRASRSMQTLLLTKNYIESSVSSQIMHSTYFAIVHFYF